MHHEHREVDAEERVVCATEVEPAPRDRRPPPRPGAAARRAMALALLGVFGLGIVLAPMALARGRQARLALIDAPHQPGAGTASTAIALAKASLAVQLLIACTAIPWILFMLSRLQGE